jgi:hypothetical protein
LLCLILTGCNGQRTIKKKLHVPLHRTYTAHTSQQSNPPITVWIHGTRFFPRRALQEAFHGKTGLKHAEAFPTCHYLRAVAETLDAYAPEQFPFDTFYFFGWSGKLNANIRAESAHVLYAELKRIRAEYKQQYHAAPVIQLITHSHGGNVALNLARIYDDEDPLCIDRLVMLACPVQTKTMDLICSPMFNKAYVLYSSLDLVQVIAPQLRKKHCRSKHALKFPPFSHRRFPSHPHVTQVKVKVNGRALFHNEFNKPHFVRLLPHILDDLESWELPCDYENMMASVKPNNLLCVYTQHILDHQYV